MCGYMDVCLDVCVFDVWVCGCVDVWMCVVDVWVCGCVEVSMCGRVGVSTYGCVNV